MMEKIILTTEAELRSLVYFAVLDALNERNEKVKVDAQTIYGLQGLADFLGIGVTTAWKLVRDGKIPKHQAGKKMFFKASEVEKATAIF